MAWRVEYLPTAAKRLVKLDRQTAACIAAFIAERVAKSGDPRALGEPLKGVLRQFWRYRVGDYRILCRIEEDRLVVLVVRLGHRREVYS